MAGSTQLTGANMVLWETDPGNTGYPSKTTENAKILAGSISGTGAVTSSSTGSFSFPSGYSCDPGTFLYITSTGGNPGLSAGSTNPDLVLASYVGPCSEIANGTSNIKVTINEATTVAFAYALGAFTYVDNGSNGVNGTGVGGGVGNTTTGGIGGAPGLQGVYVGAPANNAATTGSCTGVGSSMTCVAAGLSHAFNNYFAIMDSFRTDGSTPTSAREYNPYAPNSSVPTAQIYTLANIMQYCSNSTGLSSTGLTSAGATDATTCGNLLSNTKVQTCTTNVCAPADTLTSMINVAKNPGHEKGACTVTGPYTATTVPNSLYCFVSGTSPFNPTLTSSALSHDWAIGITYTGGTIGAPQQLALDANDDVYVLNGNTMPVTSTNVVAMAANGAQLWQTSTTTQLCTPEFIATDTIGDVWITNGANSTGCTSPPAYGVFGYYQATGYPTPNQFTGSGALSGLTATYGLAVDQYNDLWFDRNVTTTTSSSPYLFEIPYSGGSSPGGTYGSVVNIANGLGNLNQIVIDGNQNVWVSTLGTSSSSTPQDLYVVPNLNAPATYGGVQTQPPAYPGATSTSHTPFYSLAGNNGYSYGLAIDAAGDAWDTDSNTSSALATEVTETTSGGTGTNGGVITGISDSTTTISSFETKPYGTEFDGAGALFYAYYSSSGEFYYIYNPLGTSVTGGSAPSNQGVIPCYAVNGATSCASSVIAYDPAGLQIDSAGTVWLAARGAGTTANPGSVIQFIGLATPTWPQLSYAHFGTKPQ